ncbi:unnamed protein product [Paramecium primaurelia]|uniref:ABC transmembrane type-1 domain-containing protein n=1 Tax=Paramecium primaurelia TaxID=5886 RepID=A0A8S1Q9K5_PARPR|nr:unnamed protein product [Paramecium primaurelia]
MEFQNFINEEFLKVEIMFIVIIQEKDQQIIALKIWGVLSKPQYQKRRKTEREKAGFFVKTLILMLYLYFRQNYTGKLQFVTYYPGGGFGIMLLIAIWNTLIGKFLMKYQQTILKEKDKRTNCAIQIFSQIKFIKINVFEQFFREKLFKLRQIEIDITRKRYFGTSIMHLLLGHQLSDGSTFLIISLFQMLQQPFLQLSIAINEVMATNIS